MGDKCTSSGWLPVGATPYREPAPCEIPIVSAEPGPVGLVRANGSNCACAPPGFFFCWWYSVAKGDRWFCRHGGGWIRKYDGTSWWECIPPKDQQT